jgi:transposase InsO family protein
MRAEGHAVESICAVLRGQGVQVAARSYRARKSWLPALRTLEDARITDALRDLLVPDGKGRPHPEVIYGRRKMTVWLRRNGFPEASKHTVDRLMRAEGMNGLVRGRKTRTTIPRKDGRRARDLLNRDFHVRVPNHTWVTDSPMFRSGPGSSTSPWSSTCTVGDAHDNAAAETVMGLFKNEAVATGSPFRTGALKTEADVIEVVFV